jgi:hypothetical protein
VKAVRLNPPYVLDNIAISEVAEPGQPGPREIHKSSELRLRGARPMLTAYSASKSAAWNFTNALEG